MGMRIPVPVAAAMTSDTNSPGAGEQEKRDVQDS